MRQSTAVPGAVPAAVSGSANSPSGNPSAQKTPPQDASGRFTTELTPEALSHRQHGAYQMRLAGASYRDIARAYGVGKDTAARDVKAVHDLAMAEAFETTEQMRQVSASRLDIALFAVMPLVKAGSLKAVDTMLRIEKRRAELLGLDAPKRFEHTGENGSPIEMNSNVNIREQWTPQEAAARAQELLRRLEVINRENNNIAAERQKKAERN